MTNDGRDKFQVCHWPLYLEVWESIDKILVPRFNMIVYYILHIICYKLYIIYNTLYVIALNIIIITLLCIWKCEKALIGLLAPRFNISAIKGTSAVGLGRNFQPFLQPHFHLFFLTSYFHSYLFLCHDFSTKSSFSSTSCRCCEWAHLSEFISQCFSKLPLYTLGPFPTKEGCWGKWR